MSADSREELEYRLEFVLNEIRNIKIDMFNTELTSRIEDYIRGYPRRIKLFFIFILRRTLNNVL